VYKAADEGIARVYWQDWQVPSIGLRPHTVYGPGRDQGLTSAPTVAMLAAAAKRPFTIPFSGALQMQYAGEVADAIARAALAEPAGTGVFDLCGSVTTVEAVVAIVRRLLPQSDIRVEGGELPIPASFSDEALVRRIGAFERVDLEDGIARCIDRFGYLLDRGLVEAPG
jgi:nucleoside-diphosphate-sugar epimerase